MCHASNNGIAHADIQSSAQRSKSVVLWNLAGALQAVSMLPHSHPAACCRVAGDGSKQPLVHDVEGDIWCLLLWPIGNLFLQDLLRTSVVAATV